MKIILISIIFWSNFCLAQDDLTLKTNRDYFEKMPLISMQPMLNFCREKHLKLNSQLEEVWSEAKPKLVNVSKNITLNGMLLRDQPEMDAPIDIHLSKQVQMATEAMAQGVNNNAIPEKYCPYLIQKLKSIDERVFQDAVESQYNGYIKRVKRLQKDSKAE